jgi:hypothetical protein
MTFAAARLVKATTASSFDKWQLRLGSEATE